MNRSAFIIASITLTGLLSVQPTYADKSKIHKSLEKSRHKHAATVTSLVVLGTVAAGPIGFIAGLLGGAYLGESNMQDTENLINANNQIDKLEVSLNQQKMEIVELEQNLVKKLEFAVMFQTGEDTINRVEEERLRTLALYLKENTSLHIRLDGHADPRGTEEYNNVLSAERAASVAKTLNDHGVAYSRIMVNFHGSRLADTTDASLDQFSLERRVDIEIYDPSTENPIVSAN